MAAMTSMRGNVLLSSMLLLVPVAAESQAVVVGRVVDARTEAPIAGAAVGVEGVERRVVTDSAGRYVLTRVPAGPQMLRADRLGYATVRVEVAVPGSGTLRRDLRMAETALAVEGIVVTADAAGRARGELGTASVVGEEAIRQQNAVSLAGVLELVPGMQMEPPGLDGVSQVSLRSVPTSGAGISSGGPSAGALASFGTLIVLDGVPMSNNANLQSLGQRGELSFATAAGGGIDLRSIPAATIERVEVIRGVPSARYGDLTQGAIIVDTRTAAIPPEGLVRYDARSAEGSVVGGHAFGDDRQAASFTTNVARTRSNPGVTDDHTVRLAGQLAHRLTAGARDQLTLDTRIDGFQLYDDRPENPNTRPERSSWSRDRGLRVSERARLELDPDTRLTFTGSYSRTEQSSFSESPRARGPQPFTDRLTEGQSEGRFVIGLYQSEITVDGAPQLLYGRLELAAEREWLGFGHELRAGADVRREWSAGPGYQFDMEFPPQVTFNAVQGYDRPRRYDAVPPLALGALYIDDRMSRSLPGDVVLNLQAGLRADALHEGGWWFSGVRDLALQPRLNAELIPWRWLRLRAGWGRTAKAPSLGQLYPAPQYHDVVNVNYYANDPAERLAVLTTIIKDPTNRSLGLSRATKSELGVELALGNTTVQVVGFADRIDGGVAPRYDLETVRRDLYELTDSVLGNGIPPQIIEPPYATDTIPVLVARSDHLIMQETRGIEVTAVFPEVRALRTRLQVQGAWTHLRQENDGRYFGRASLFSNFQLENNVARVPYWAGGIEEGERALATYRLIHHQPEIGLVLTAAIQHNLHDRVRDRTATDTLAFQGYVTRGGELVPVPEEDRTLPQYEDLRISRSGSISDQQATPADWHMSIQVTKTLPLDGRLSFWAYNLMDNRGIYRDPEVQRRIYHPMRFGLELTMSTAGLRGWRP